MTRTILVLAALGIPIGVAAQSSPTVSDAANSITARDIARRIGVIAHDSMRGRNTPSPELDQAAAYIASEFQQFGLRPGGDDGDYIQRYPLRRTRLYADGSWVAIANGPRWQIGEDVLVQFGSLNEPVVGPAAIIDGTTGDLSVLEDVELAGKVVFIVASPGPMSGQIVQNVFSGVFTGGPAALILVSQRSDVIWDRLKARQARAALRTAWSEGGGAALLEVRDTVVAASLREHGYDLAAVRTDSSRPVTVTLLDELTVEVSLQYETLLEATAPNVVGILEGSDPTLKNEYVLFSAHMDHVGVGRPIDGDSVYNGADDNASGTIGVVEAAEAFALLEPRPKRSLIFLAVSGEEKGLWGSEFFAQNPTVPLSQIVANINADMLGRNWTDTVVVIGKEHSDLGETLHRVNAEHPELNMTAIDDIWPEERFYYRSDHFNFARKGVPILFFFTGTHADYHRPSDHTERIDAEKESRIVKLMFYLGLEIANAAERPQWDPESYAQIVERPVVP